MSKSCQGLLQEFVRCLLDTDCVKVHCCMRSPTCELRRWNERFDDLSVCNAAHSSAA